jgi:hypothetical protein
MKKNKFIQVKLSPLMMDRLKQSAEADLRSVTKQVLFIVTKYLKENTRDRTERKY